MLSRSPRWAGAERRAQSLEDRRNPPIWIKRVEAIDGRRVRVVWESCDDGGDIIDLGPLFEHNDKYSSLLLDEEEFKKVRLDANGEAISWGYGRQVPSKMLKGMVDNIDGGLVDSS